MQKWVSSFHPHTVGRHVTCNCFPQLSSLCDVQHNPEAFQRRKITKPSVKMMNSCCWEWRIERRMPWVAEREETLHSTCHGTICKDYAVLLLEVALNDFLYLKVNGSTSLAATFSAQLNEDFGEFSLIRRSHPFIVYRNIGPVTS